MNIAGINYESINDGEGVRTVIYVSGCSHKCPKCHNPQTHNVDYGIKFTNELQDEIINNIKKRPFISGITLSGGDPLHNNNLTDVFNLIMKIKERFPDKSLWLYTGYRFEDIINIPSRRRIIEQCDVVIDGRYIDELRDVTLKFRGSSNQRVIDVQKTLSTGEVVLWLD